MSLRYCLFHGLALGLSWLPVHVASAQVTPASVTPAPVTPAPVTPAQLDELRSRIAEVHDPISKFQVGLSRPYDGFAPKDVFDGLWLEHAEWTDAGHLRITGRRWAYDPPDAATWERIPKAALVRIVRDFLARGWAGAAPDASERTPIDVSGIRPVKSPLDKIWETVSDPEENLQGVRIDFSYYDKDEVLHVVGLCANATQRHRIGQLVSQAIPRALSEFEEVPLDEFLNLLQERIGADRNGTRWTDAEFLEEEDGVLKIACETWEDPAEIFPEIANKEVSDLLLESRFHDLQYGGTPKIVGRQISSPMLKIRRLVAEHTDLDGVRIDRGFFDAQRRLTFTGIRRARGQESRFLELVEERLAADREITWSDLVTYGPASASLADPPEDLVGYLQNQIRRQPSGFDRVRIDRMYFDENNLLRLAGIRWGISEEAATDRLPQLIKGWLRGREEDGVWQAGLWEGGFPDEVFPIHLDNPDNHLTVGIVYAENALSHLRNLVKERPKLDGVGIEAGYYDDQGKLHFEFIQDRPDQQTQLEQVLQEDQNDSVLWNDWAKPSSSDSVQLKLIRTVPFEQMLVQLRRDVAQDERLDGTWLKRAYYTYESDERKQIVVEGHCWQNVQAGLQQLAERLPAATKAAWDGRHFVFDVQDPHAGHTLLGDLRLWVTTQRELDGVRLDRAYYPETGVLTFNGLVGSPAQRARLDDELSRWATQTIWQEHLANRWNLEGLAVISLADILPRIGDLIDYYPELDGVVVKRVYYSLDGKLSLVGHASTEEQLEELVKMIEQHLGLDVNWSIIVKFGISLDGMEIWETISDPERAATLTNSAWKLFHKACYREAIALLGQAVVYDKKHISAWYLRGLCYIRLKDLARAERDIYRGAKIEQEKPASFSHYAFLRRVQGQTRLCFERLWLTSLTRRPGFGAGADHCAKCNPATGECCSPCCDGWRPSVKPLPLSGPLPATGAGCGGQGCPPIRSCSSCSRL